MARQPCRSWWVVALPLSAALAGALAAQTPAALDLPQAVRQAEAQYPALLAAAHAAARAQAEVGVARVSKLPVAGLSAQWDRGTDNAVLGLSFPSPLPAISGTVPLADYSWRSAWTSATGGYFSWEVLDFGRRDANIRYYQALAAQAADQLDLTRLQVGARAADAFLTVLASGQQATVAAADVSRWGTLAAIIHALVAQQLRPGADASRADAELAGARIRFEQAQRDRDNAGAALAEALGVASGPAPPLAGVPPLGAAPATPPAAATPRPEQHPQARAQNEAVASSRARIAELARAPLPRWYLLASLYERGTGVLAPGHFATGLGGLAPVDAGNAALGFGLDFSFTRWTQARRERQAARQQLAQEQARYRQILGQLQQARQQAANDLAAALRIAAQSPVELRAAQAGEGQARVRYQAGLVGIADLADAEQLLAQAQTDDALSELRVWRALLESAFAAGDLRPFLAAAAPGATP